MIVINSKEYNDYTTKISWGNFSVFQHGKRREGIAPFISFNVENSKFIGIELTFSDEMFEQMEENVTTNVKEYISDVLYDDERGWISIIDGEYNVDITRIDEKNFKIEFYIKACENISIDSVVALF